MSGNNERPVRKDVDEEKYPKKGTMYVRKPTETGYLRGTRRTRRRADNTFRNTMIFLMAMMVVLTVYNPYFGDYFAADTPDEQKVSLSVQVYALNPLIGPEPFDCIVELHNPSGEYGGQLLDLLYYNGVSPAVFSYTLTGGKSYELWVFPFQNETVYKSPFVAPLQETYLYTMDLPYEVLL